MDRSNYNYQVYGSFAGRVQSDENRINRRKLLKLVTRNCLRAKENRVEFTRSLLRGENLDSDKWLDKSGKNGS